VGNGQAALERLAQHVDDLIVCDLHLPDVDGRAIYRVIAWRSSRRQPAGHFPPAASKPPSKPAK
jgi:CheY-like chemotaxis protein